MTVTLRTLPFNPSTGKFQIDGHVERVLPKFLVNLIYRETETDNATIQDFIDIANSEISG